MARVSVIEISAPDATSASSYLRRVIERAGEAAPAFDRAGIQLDLAPEHLGGAGIVAGGEQALALLDQRPVGDLVEGLVERAEPVRQHAGNAGVLRRGRGELAVEQPIDQPAGPGKHDGQRIDMLAHVGGDPARRLERLDRLAGLVEAQRDEADQMQADVAVGLERIDLLRQLDAAVEIVRRDRRQRGADRVVAGRGRRRGGDIDRFQQ
jgi:hypothetical protein